VTGQPEVETLSSGREYTVSNDSATMNVNDTTMPAAPPPPGSSPDKGVAPANWLGSQSIFDRKDERKIGRAMSASVIVHVGLVLLVVAAMTVAPAELLRQEQPLEYKVVFKQDPGPGGGGGGSPAPAPAKKMEIPKHKAPEVAPIAVPKPVEPPPIPTLNAPIETTASTVLQSMGTSSVSLSQYGGGGRGGGVGSGTGNGVGPGTGGGFGGGAFRPGSGVSFPTLLRQEQPKYTSEAMRAKIQGLCVLEAVVLENGTVGEVRVIKSLDKQFGLDQEAMVAAKRWLFRPGVGPDGKPVATVVTLELEFRLH